MKTPKIPKGWHKLRKGTVIKQGDKVLSGRYWYLTGAQGSEVERHWFTQGPYIRRIKPAKPHAL